MNLLKWFKRRAPDEEAKKQLADAAKRNHEASLKLKQVLRGENRALSDAMSEIAEGL